MDVASGLQFYGSTEKNGIVIDIGSVYTKVGFVGESHPRAIIQTDLQACDGSKVNFFPIVSNLIRFHYLCNTIQQAHRLKNNGKSQ